MRKTGILALFLVIVCLLAGCKGKENNQEDEVKENGMVKSAAEKELTFLKAKGENSYNQSGEGELVQLRGVNVGGWLFQEFWMTPTDASTNIKAELDIYEYLIETYGEEKMWEIITAYQDAYFTEADFDHCKEVGMNCLRLPFWYLNLVDMGGNFSENWYQRFDWFIENAKERGMYVILDFHGAPGSQSGSDHSGVDCWQKNLK